MWQDIFSAIALMLVFEGIMPFLNPDRVRQNLLTLIELDNSSMRTMGMIIMLLGLFLLYAVK